MPPFQLGLSKEREQILISTITIHDDDFLTPVPRHLVGAFLQQVQLQLPAAGNRAGFVAGFKDLAKVVFRKNYSILLISGVQSGVANIRRSVPNGR